MKKKTFTRPEGWQKKIKSSYFDKSKNFAGEDYNEQQIEEDKKNRNKPGFFKRLRNGFKK